MQLIKKISCGLLIVCLVHTGAQGQFLKKLKEKVNSTVSKSTTGTGQNQADAGNTSSSGKPSNTKGGGLTNTTPPDVNQQIADAKQSHAAGNYSDARYSIQQALMGIELQIGRQILFSLPAMVDGLARDTMQNKVMSTQWGWNNMTIQSVYKKDDKQMTVTIGNNSVYSGFVNIYFNSAYSQSTSDGKNQNVKQTKVKNYKAIITYDESKGYTLLVQIGQSSLIVWECINFATEAEVMSAANAFNIDGIKKMLGEQ